LTKLQKLIYNNRKNGDRMLTQTFKDEVRDMKTSEEIHEGWELLRRKSREIQSQLTYSFDVGDNVSFRTREAVLTKINQKSIGVKVGIINWKVAPSLLTKE
jgi:hypothetical protein